MRVLKEHFQSINQMLETINTRPNNKVMKEKKSSHNASREFTMTNSWNEAISLFRYGYTDILSEIKAGMTKDAKFQTPAARRKMKTAVQGFVPHVPNAVIGLPNSMINIESEVKKTKAISIVYSITGNAMVNAREFVRSGIAVLSTIHALELRGIRVNLKIMFYNAKCENERAFGTVNLKHYSEHLDLQKLCFPVTHPSMFRRIGFRWLETLPGLKEDEWSRGYGKQIEPSEIHEMKDLFEENEYYLSLEITNDCHYTVDKIIEYLNLK